MSSECSICGSELHLESNCDSADAIHDRVLSAYEYLVDETENRMTIFDGKKNEMLSFLLEVFEYLRGNQEENPIEEFFE